MESNNEEKDDCLWSKYKYIILVIALLAICYIVYIYLYGSDMNFVSGLSSNSTKPLEPFFGGESKRCSV